MNFYSKVSLLILLAAALVVLFVVISAVIYDNESVEEPEPFVARGIYIKGLGYCELYDLDEIKDFYVDGVKCWRHSYDPSSVPYLKYVAEGYEDEFLWDAVRTEKLPLELREAFSEIYQGIRLTEKWVKVFEAGY